MVTKISGEKKGGGLKQHLIGGSSEQKQAAERTIDITLEVCVDITGELFKIDKIIRRTQTGQHPGKRIYPTRPYITT